MTGGYEGLGGKEYDPNPRGAEIPYKVEPYADPGSTVRTTVEKNGDIRVEVVTNGRTDGRMCGGAVVTPADTGDREWVLYTAEHDGACMIAWWPNDPRPIGPDAAVPDDAGGRPCRCCGGGRGQDWCWGRRRWG